VHLSLFETSRARAGGSYPSWCMWCVQGTKLDAYDHGECTHLATTDAVHDGYGAQLKRRLSVWAYARVHGLVHVYSPLKKVRLCRI
jgi:hypothetical protein